VSSRTDRHAAAVFIAGVDGQRSDGLVSRVQAFFEKAGSEVVLSLGAIQTPKVLMRSGIGDTEQLRSFGIGVVQHLL